MYLWDSWSPAVHFTMRRTMLMCMAKKSKFIPNILNTFHVPDTVPNARDKKVYLNSSSLAGQTRSQNMHVIIESCVSKGQDDHLSRKGGRLKPLSEWWLPLNEMGNTRKKCHGVKSEATWLAVPS